MCLLRNNGHVLALFILLSWHMAIVVQFAIPVHVYVGCQCYSLGSVVYILHLLR